MWRGVEVVTGGERGGKGLGGGNGGVMEVVFLEWEELGVGRGLKGREEE